MEIIEKLADFLVSALLGIGLLVVVVLLARKAMIKEMKAKETEENRAGDAESRGAPGASNED